MIPNVSCFFFFLNVSNGSGCAGSLKFAVLEINFNNFHKSADLSVLKHTSIMKIFHHAYIFFLTYREIYLTKITVVVKGMKYKQVENKI